MRPTSVAGASVVALALAGGGGWIARRFVASTPAPALGTPEACAAYDGLPRGWPKDEYAGMVWIEGGSIELGSRHGYADERPAGIVEVDGFWIDRTEVTNAQFSAFVSASGYVTEAEHEGGASVFQPSESEDASRGDEAAVVWWRYVEGASWRQPEGPGSGLEGRENQPVVQVTYRDASTYARWYGRDLPSEAEWEFAARSGSEASNESAPRDDAGHPTANFWQGMFPWKNDAEDGYRGRAPVGCFPTNRAGLHDMIGNVWELTRDVYEGEHRAHCAARIGARADPDDPRARRDKPIVIKGGSFLCAPSFCARYRSSARYPQEARLAAAHIGFRTVKSTGP